LRTYRPDCSSLSLWPWRAWRPCLAGRSYRSGRSHSAGRAVANERQSLFEATFGGIEELDLSGAQLCNRSFRLLLDQRQLTTPLGLQLGNDLPESCVKRLNRNVVLLVQRLGGAGGVAV
jgi:hypothetical protein